MAQTLPPRTSSSRSPRPTATRGDRQEAVRQLRKVAVSLLSLHAPVPRRRWLHVKQHEQVLVFPLAMRMASRRGVVVVGRGLLVSPCHKFEGWLLLRVRPFLPVLHSSGLLAVRFVLRLGLEVRARTGRTPWLALLATTVATPMGTSSSLIL